MRAIIRSFRSKKWIAMSLFSIGATSLVLGGYALADVKTKTTASQVKTLTMTLSYSDILGAQSDGGNGYLLNLSSFPANARIMAADYYIKVPFSITPPDGQDVSTFATVNLVVPNTGTYINDVAQGYFNNTGYAPQLSPTASDPILPTQGELVLDVSNIANNGSSLSNLNAGQVTINIVYVQYQTP